MVSTRQLFLDHLAQTSASPLLLEIVHAEGVYMYDANGKAYIDLISGIGVSNVGHRHPYVVKAIKEQLNKYLHLMVYGEFIQSPQVQLAKAITETLAPHLNTVYFVNSGSEAIEGAVKLAKRYTGKPQIVACHTAYHGSSHGALSLAGDETLKRNYRPLLPGIHHIRFDCSNELDAITKNTAAFVVETIQGEAGIRISSRTYWEKVRQRCDETGALLVMDEIQCGFGRTGALWAHQHYDIAPDILVCAKGMGGGMPIGCFIASRSVMRVLAENPALGHITTFGGHPVSSAASLAALQVMQKESLPESVEKKERVFLRLLKHAKIKEVRSIGLLIAVEFESSEILKCVIDKAIERGVITDWFLFNDRSMRIAPPLTITEEEIKKACKAILEAIEEVR